MCLWQVIISTTSGAGGGNQSSFLSPSRNAREPPPAVPGDSILRGFPSHMDHEGPSSLSAPNCLWSPVKGAFREHQNSSERLKASRRSQGKVAWAGGWRLRGRPLVLSAGSPISHDINTARLKGSPMVATSTDFKVKLERKFYMKFSNSVMRTNACFQKHLAGLTEHIWWWMPLGPMVYSFCRSTHLWILESYLLEKYSTCPFTHFQARGFPCEVKT